MIMSARIRAVLNSAAVKNFGAYAVPSAVDLSAASTKVRTRSCSAVGQFMIAANGSAASS